MVRVPRAVVVVFALLVSLGLRAADDGVSIDDALKAGQTIYRQKCAMCHGAEGEGVAEHYGKPLAGDRTVKDLAQVITDTMPEEDPDACVGEEAVQVAAYIHEAFYSEVAQARRTKARIELSRLTVRQYQNSVMDLVGSFGEPSRWDGERGLRGEYFKSRNFRGSDRRIDRRDPMVDFDFGEASPGEDIDVNEFAIRWDGSVFAPDTGDYEFIVRTENGVRLWVNDTERPLIDAWVRSGTDLEHRETIRLLGGRAYRLRLEFFKSERGKEKVAAVSLLWKRPNHVDELIAERYLAPYAGGTQFVVNTPFPPDDRSVGYERGTTVSKQWDQAATLAAIETAGYVAENVNRLAATRNNAADYESRVKEFCYQFVERAFRRPLNDELRQFFVDRQFAAAESVDIAVKRVVLLALKSPRFLYREVDSAPSVGDAQSESSTVHDYDVAARLAFALWDSLPDRELLDAAAKGQLHTAEQVRVQADRMSQDLRARAKLHEFLHTWLRVDHIQDLSKNAEIFPEFDEMLVSDLRTSLDLFLDEVISNSEADFRQLLQSERLFANGRLAAFYGIDLPEDAPFQSVALDPRQRAGVVSHPFLLSGFAYYDTSSPIHRGVFIARSLLGRSLRVPPEAVAPLSPDLHADLNTRERVTLQTSPAVCQSCHSLINPLGFSLEHYDAAGRYRIEEKGRPIDATGHYDALDGTSVDFRGVRELADYLVNSQETQSAFVEQLFHHAVKQPINAFGPRATDELRQSFSERDFNMRKLLVEIATRAAMTAR
ncbi:MAG: DUF1592 domain-containing protein [Planctomycetales bacterium]|nr:DUF1592 domain-containing protein [Planctomycetales bacterium]